MSAAAATLEEIQAGRAESRTLTEILALDHAELMRHVIPGASPALLAEIAAAQELGILARMQSIGAALLGHLGGETCEGLTAHASDTVRGWGWFALAARDSGLGPEEIVRRSRPAADDPHFGVREWAWLAVRPALVETLDASIAALARLTSDPSERVRRFGSEALRPRGVWARHIAELKREPERGEPVLEPLRADPARYVQDSVANWINDAAKTRPDWARGLGERWLAESPGAATERIVRRGLRSL